MWMLLGIGAIVFAGLNLLWSFRSDKQEKGNAICLFRFISMSLTALTLCAFYADGAGRVAAEDWGGLMDVMPTMSRSLWVCTCLSILINSLSLFNKN